MTDVYESGNGKAGSAASAPPGPPLPGVVQSALFLRNPVGYLEGCQARYGDVFRVRFVGFPRFVYVADPDLVRDLYAADRTVGRAGEARRDFLEPLVGEHSLLCTEGEPWLRHRKMLGPVFHRNHVDGYAAEIARIASREVLTWPTGRPFALRPRMQAITLEVILRLVFGVSDESRIERFRTAIPSVLQPTDSPMLWLLPPALWGSERMHRVMRRFPNPLRSFLEARDRLDELIFEEIARRRDARDEDADDVLSLLLGARDEEGRPMSDVELRDELVTLLEAGHETTATALTWTFERLVRNPRVLARLCEELDGGAGEEYLDAVARETLRARPVVIDTPRYLAGPLELGDYTIPSGWYVAPAIPNVQLDSRATPAPAEFRPERFVENPPRDGWIPFGGGKRHCVGSHLALLELRVVVREVLRRLDLTAADPKPEGQRLHHVTLVPSAGGRVIARKRSGSLRERRTGAPRLLRNAPATSRVASSSPRG